MNAAINGYEGPTAPLQPAAPAVEFSAEVKEYLAEVKVHIIEHLDDFKEPERPGPMLPLPFAFPEEPSPFLEYDVNVAVDNSATQGAPVLVETAPTYLNRFGTIERVADPLS